ncbi:MAG: class I SAM-dependent methyltransferase [Pirellulales bacterium]|nr:class I SAM-dependent methyltransferase [Pirellulales bacterium]
MDPILPPELRTTDDWDRAYREGLPPWETGEPADELIRVLRDHRKMLRGPTAIDLGCGSGADAIYLAKAGFDVTAVEISPIAMERARARTEMKNAAVHFVLDDVFKFAEDAGKFDLILDAGFYEFVRQKNLGRLLDALWRLSSPGSFYFMLAANAEDEPGDQTRGANTQIAAADPLFPPGVTRREIHLELGRLFEVVELRPCRLPSPQRPEGYPGWSCLMRRPQPPTR